MHRYYAKHVAPYRDELHFVALLSRPPSASAFGRVAAIEPLLRRLLALEPRTHLLGQIDLCRAIDCLGDAPPDGRKTATECGFQPL